MAQLGAPDMRIPIQVALTWLDRLPLDTKRIDLPTLAKLTFFEPDFNKFRCLALAFEAGHLTLDQVLEADAEARRMTESFLK